MEAKENHVVTKRTWTLAALLVNICLLPLVLAPPREAAAERRARFFFPCCQESARGEPYCCDGCCIFTWDCRRHDTCGDQ